MYDTDTLVIGAGQAGLAVSHYLSARGRDHLLIDRGQVAERWKSERWDSLRLLTPNWMTRLPGHTYRGADPDGFMTATQVAEFLDDYARSFAAPVVEHTVVRRLTQRFGRFAVDTDRGTFTANSVVVATGWCDQAAVPTPAAALSADLCHVVPSAYRRPADLPDGGVLVVGASATGVQLADELQQSGRAVTLAVGSHSRLPREYRGMDIFWWLDLIGAFDRTVDDCIEDIAAARREPSLQLAGRPDRSAVDLPSLHARGVRIVGRVIDADRHHVGLGRDLDVDVSMADGHMARMLARIDAAVERLGLTSEVLEPERPATLPALPAPHRIDLRAEQITSVVWATGYRRNYSWLDLPILDEDGEIRHRRGVTPMPGVYVLGQRFQHHRNSNFIDGVGRDAAYIADRICSRRHGHTSAGIPRK
jgi:putative flavoprotein involved in K+ transport